MHRRLAPMPFGNDGREGHRAQRNSPVVPTRVSECATAKAGTKLVREGLPDRGLTTLLAGQATLTLDKAALRGQPGPCLPATGHVDRQGRTFELPETGPAENVAMQVPGWIRRIRSLAP